MTPSFLSCPLAQYLDRPLGGACVTRTKCHIFLDMKIIEVIKLIQPVGLIHPVGLTEKVAMTTKHSLKSSSKSDKKIDMIATAAAKLFSMKGYIETSMEDIAVTAKLSKGGMYHYFDCKEDILYFILANFMDSLLEGLEQDIQNIEDPAGKIRYVISHHVEAYVAHVYSAKVLLNEAFNLSARKLSKIKSRERLYFSTVAGVLSLYVGHNLDNDTLRVVTFNLLGMCNWIYSWYDPQGATNPEQLSQIIFQNFVHGLSGLQGESPRK
jgi:TetR/AcrR family transcriptional regulator, cholesterol catabolism regulator